VQQRDNGYYCDKGPKRNGRSALTYAAENASIELIKLLVDAGSNVKVIDSDGNNLDFYINKNPRFSIAEKAQGFEGILKKYSKPSDINPSFSCSAKLNRLEKAICSSKGLSIYDRELSQIYKQAISYPKISRQLKNSQIDWLKRRNNSCSKYHDDFQVNACIARTTRARIRALEYIANSFSSQGNRN
jgi:uncharacterized protein YecT (DUF1311 family)